MLPTAAAKLWPWLLTQKQDALLSLLAFCAAHSVDTVMQSHLGTDAHAAQLAEALDLDMRDYWKPTGASYFGRVPKALMLEAVTQGKGKTAADALQSKNLKTDELAAACERELTGSKWLPSILREHEKGDGRKAA